MATFFMGFPRQEYLSGLPFPPPGDLSNPGIEPESPVRQEDSAAEPPGKPQFANIFSQLIYCLFILLMVFFAEETEKFVCLFVCFPLQFNVVPLVYF